MATVENPPASATAAISAPQTAECPEPASSGIQSVIELDCDEWAEWERITSQPPRDMPGLRAFMQRFENANGK